MIQYISSCCSERVYIVEHKKDLDELRKRVSEEDWVKSGPGVKFVCTRCGKMQVNIIIKNERRSRR